MPDEPSTPLPEAPYAVAFPGQGVDPVDLARILVDLPGDDRARALVDQLADHLGHRNWAGIDLTDTRVAQPAIYVASLVQAWTLVPHDDVEIAVGHSMGELSALAYAGVYSPGDGLGLVIRRAELGHEAQQRRPGAMAVVMRVDDTTVEWVRRRTIARVGGILEVAVVNGRGQVVVAGDVEAVDCLIDEVKHVDGVARRLPIGGGYHTPLLADAVEPYAQAIRTLDLSEPSLTIVSCTTAAPVPAAADVERVLSRALVLPVRWVDTMDAIRALGVTRAVDAGPGATIANVARYTPVLDVTALSPAGEHD